MNSTKVKPRESKAINSNNNSKYCISCEFTGIIHNPHFEQLGTEPLAPCPKCVKTKCKCGGISPYYYNENGKILQCSCRETALKIQKIKSIYAKSGIDKKYRWKFINNYEVINKATEQAKNTAYNIIREFPNVKKGLFLWGNPGTGKTLLSSIILTELITRHGIDGKYIKISRTFFNRIKSTFNESSPTYGEADLIEREFAEVDLLVIDDFGVQRDSEWELETLYNLVDARYEALKFTIFTSNVNPSQSMKDKSHGRILSRIKEMCSIIELSGADYRDRL
ncbi:MAG: ATP-binding protein [Spirochaetes bacterium]|nr:ATP-binding protein [Spirochaetota bacterium]